MNSRSRVFVVGFVFLFTGGFALHVCASPSECFYALVPPVSLAINLTGVLSWRDAFEQRIRPIFRLIGFIFALSLAAALLLFGPRIVLSWRFWLEVSACIYYLSAMLLVLLAIRGAILAFSQALHARWNFSPGIRLALCEALPLALLVLFALPLAIAFAHVHRFKMPNFADPRAFHGRDFEEIEFTSRDGIALRGWWIPAKTSRQTERTLIICHGIAANRSLFLPFVEVGDWLDANVLMFDLRGHGDSGGRTITLGYREKDDILAAVAFARREKSPCAREVIGLGISLGAASLAEASALADPPLDAVILDSSFTSTRDMTHAVLGHFPSSSHPWLLTLGTPLADWHAGCAMMSVSPEDSIARLRSPVLFLHSRGDPLIPSDHAVRLHATARTQKRLRIFDLPGHCDAFFASKQQYRAEVTAFVSNLGKQVRAE